MRGTLGGLGLGSVSLQEFGGPSDVLIRVQQQEGDEQAQVAAIEKVKAALGADMEYRRVEYVGPQGGEELIESGFLAVGLALLAILISVSFRFEVAFGVGAVGPLTDGIVATVGSFSLTQLEFNLRSE